MKKLFGLSICLLIGASVVSLGACKKSKGDDDSCKTCRAFSVDGEVGSREVCSEVDEAKFQ